MMKQRVLTGLLLAAVTLTLLWIGGAVLGVAFATVICVGIYEEYHVLSAAGHRTVSWPTWAGIALSIPMLLTTGAQMVTPLLMIICLVTLACVLFRKEPRMEDVLMSMLPLCTVALPGMCLISLLLVEPTPVRLTLLFLVFAVPCVGDIFALLVGRSVGGPKLCPAVSPNKTISGALGGLAGSVAAAMLVCGISYLICSPVSDALLPAWWHCLLLGLIGGAAGQIGDLCFSMIKRHCGVKDYSNIFPGHGGMLDRLDSILFMAMVMFCYRMILTL